MSVTRVMWPLMFPVLLLAAASPGCNDVPEDGDSSVSPSPTEQPEFADFQADPDALDFGDVALGASADLDVQVANTGDVAISLRVRLPDDGGGQFSLLDDTDTFSLAPGDAIPITVVFTPSSLGAQSGTLELVTNDSSELQAEVPLQGTGVSPDADGDGYPADEDCDDTDPDVHPGALELCDGRDNDCNQAVDDNAADATEWYLDADTDGYGGDDQILACDQPDSSYVLEPGDCDDTDATIHPDASEICDGVDNDCDGEIDEDATDASTWYLDEDADGYGTDATVAACTQLEGYTATPGDCDDTNPVVYPGADELCDGLDNDCDCAGQDDSCVPQIDEDAVDAPTWYQDLDADGVGGDSALNACTQPDGYVSAPDDCDDTNPIVYPGADELCDGLDNDCDCAGQDDSCVPQVDEDAIDMGTWYVDADEDGYGTGEPVVACNPPDGYVDQGGDCRDDDPRFHPGAQEDDCTDPNDYNCDGSTGYADDDQDGFPACTDCDDHNPDAYPDATEICDGADNDCDGLVDEDLTTTLYADQDGDTYGDPDAPFESCPPQADGYSSNASDCDDTNPAVYPGALEQCNAVDDDCDGDTDEGVNDDAPPSAPTWYADGDSDGYGTDESALVACNAPEGYVDQGGDCNDADPLFHPGAVEDDCTDPNDYNCDGEVLYADEDADGVPACLDCDDTNPNAYPDAEEMCDEADNDCDGDIDEDVTTPFFADADGDGFGNADIAVDACEPPEGYVADATDCDDTRAETNPAAPEYCNEIDDDCDGEVDEPDAADCTVLYADEDGDEWGGEMSICECSIPLGYTTRPGDCDDTNPLVFPGAVEKCNLVDDDCNGEIDEEDAYQCDRYYNDQDGDGWGDTIDYKCLCAETDTYTATTAGDCNDDSAAMFPGNPETCDGLDNNCSGQIDEGVTTTYYLDNDGDGYGALYNTREACEPPEGYVALGGDCNDYNADISPGTPEVCDDIDNNCNGQVDEGIPLVTVYIDLDGDGHGAEGTAGKQACLFDSDGDGEGDTPPDGYVLEADDCDDSASTVYPGAPELCDGRLNNCNFTVPDIQCPTKCEGEWPVSVGGSSGFPVVGQLDTDNELEVVAQNEGQVRVFEDDGTLKWSTPINVSYSYPSLADMNYDNTLDVLVGAHGGTFYVLNGLDGSVLATITTGTNAGYYGTAAFDVDGDGNTDLVPTGSAPYHLLLMNRDLSVREDVPLAPLEGESFWLTSPAIYDYDGYGEATIILGSGHWSCASDPETCKGRHYVFNADGSYWNDPTWTDPALPWFEVEGYPYTYAGEGKWPVIADVDGDGVEETSHYFTNASGVRPSMSWVWNDDGTEHPDSGTAFNTSFPVLAPVNPDGTLDDSGALINAGGPVADIDNDGIYEVISSNSEGLIITKAGQVMDGFPIALSSGAKVIADINRDGRLDILFHSSSNNAVNCYTLGETTYADERILNYGTVDGLGRRWYPTNHLDPYEPNDRRAEPFHPTTSTDPVGDSRAFYLGALRDIYASGNGWYRRIRGLIGEQGDVDYYYLRGGIINVSLSGIARDYDLYVHQFHPDGTYIDTLSSTNSGTSSEGIICHSTTNCAYTNENKYFIIEVRGKDPAVDFGPFPYLLKTVWAN